MSTKRYLRLLAVFYQASLFAQMEYRANFWSSIAMTLAWPVWAVGTLSAFFYHTDNLGGWSFNEVLLVIGLYDAFVGVMEAVIVPNIRQLVEHIQQGTLDFILIKPAKSQFLGTMTACSVLRLLDIAFGFGFIFAGLYRLGHVPTLFEVLTFAVMLPAGIVTIYSIFVLLTTLAFWFVRVDNFTELFDIFYTAGRFPVTVYGRWIRFFLTFVVPIAFLTTFPAAALLGKLSASYVIASAAMALVLFYGSTRFWNYAIRFYSSASS